jgi:hypothetical protein
MKHRISSKRAGRVIPAIAGGVLLAVAALSPACKGVAVETLQAAPDPLVGAVGDPCIPSDEKLANVSGFSMNELMFEDHFAACSSGLCLVNHFQGRVSCPLGQEAPASCSGPSDPSCGSGSSCVATGNAGPYCDSTTPDAGAPQCGSGVCNAQRSTCMCTNDTECPSGSVCDQGSQECTRYICHKPGGCQSADATDEENAGKACCAEGTSTPVSKAVCGQCQEESQRTAEKAVYCSCRCGPPDGAPPDDSEYCACPTGFECSQLLPDVGLGGAQISGKYCIKQGTAFVTTPGGLPEPTQCGQVSGYLDSSCEGIKSP